jgi:hypothetical protein
MPGLHGRVAAGDDVGLVAFAPDLDQADAAGAGRVVGVGELAERRDEVAGGDLATERMRLVLGELRRACR